MVPYTRVAFCLLVMAVFLATRLQTAFGYSCEGCTEMDVARCEPLPSDCEPGHTPCGCCETCRKKFGERCSGWTTACESGLACADDSNLAPTPMTWWVSMYDFEGTCKNAEDVVEKPPEYWRGNKRDHTRRDSVNLP